MNRDMEGEWWEQKLEFVFGEEQKKDEIIFRILVLMVQKREVGGQNVIYYYYERVTSNLVNYGPHIHTQSPGIMEYTG